METEILSKYDGLGGPFKWEWYSICSAHILPIASCKACITGKWHNVWLTTIDAKIYNYLPKVWKWWHNLWPLQFQKYK